jgi:hypothetical protein
MRVIFKLKKGPWMRIICKLAKRALDADYLKVKEDGPGRGLFAKCRKGHVCGVARGKGGLGLGFFTVMKGASIVDF